MAARVAQLRKQVLDESMQDTAYLRLVYGAQIEQSKHTLKIVEYELAKTRVVSPLDGVVLEKHLDSDQYVQPGAPLVAIGDPASMEIRADILSDEIGRVRPGQKVILVGKAIRTPDATGVVRKIYPSGFTKVSSLGVRQQRVIVLIDFDNSEINLRPGYELDVKIAVAQKENAVLVPSAAVFATATGSAAFAVKNGRAELRPLTVGLKGEQDYEALEGLRAGEAVILRPPLDLTPGSRVRSEGRS
jgi:HlyD family secretion protein